MVKGFKNRYNISFFLNKFFGFQRSFSFYVCSKLGYSPYLKMNFFINSDFYLIYLEVNFFYSFFFELRNLKLLKIDFFKNIKNYRGYCFLNYYPVRGQRTKNNAKTIKKFKVL
jgi:ribosomal protein S13